MKSAPKPPWFDNHFGALAEWDETQGWHNVRIPNQDTADVSDGLKIRYPDPQAKIAVRTLSPALPSKNLRTDSDSCSACARIPGRSYRRPQNRYRPADKKTADTRPERLHAARQPADQHQTNVTHKPEPPQSYAQGNTPRRQKASSTPCKCNSQKHRTAFMTTSAKSGQGSRTATT